MRGAAIRPVVIAAGGTGGHVFPAAALAEALAARGRWVALMTDARSAELAAASFGGCERYVIRGGGLAGRNLLRAAMAAGALALGVIEARSILMRIGAEAVVGFGGYPSVAPVLAARLLRRRPRIVLHEQNAVLGRANRFLARRADLLALSFAPTACVPEGVRAELVGNPVRAPIAALAGQGYAAPHDRLRVLVLGGSLGARVLSDVVPAALAALPEALRARLDLVQQCREDDLGRVRAAYRAAGIAAETAAFFNDIPQRLAQTHLVIARAGASTVAELAVAGRPAILVPLPTAIDDHQTANARALAIAGGGWLLPQAHFTAKSLAHRLGRLFEAPASLAEAAAAAARFGRADAAERLAAQVDALIGAERGR